MTIQAQIPLQHSYLSIRLRHASAWSMYTGRSDNSDADSPSTFVAVYQTETRECLKCNIQGVLTIQAKIPLQQSYFSTKLRHASAWSIIYFAFWQFRQKIPLQHSYLSTRLRHASAWSIYTGRSDNSDANSPSTFVAVYQTETRECLKCNIQGVLTIQAKIPLQQSYLSTKLRHASAWSIIHRAFWRFRQKFLFNIRSSLPDRDTRVLGV